VAANGDAVQITPKAFDALVYFLEHPGEVVERAALMETLWPNAVVEENSLSQVVVVLRHALGDGFIVTVKGRGYQFIAEVRAGALDSARAQSPVVAQADVPSPPVPSRRHTGGAKGAGRLRARSVNYWVTAVVAGALALVIVDLYLLPPSDTGRGQVVLSAPDPVLRYSETPTANQRALDFYRSARNYEWNGGTVADVELAERLYQRAVGEDPEFALAWARLSILHIESYWFGRDRSDARRQRALEAAERALELQPALPDAHIAMGWYHHHGHLDYEQALDELMVAAKSIPDDAGIHWRIAAVYRRSGQLVRALASFERAIELQPRDVLWRVEAAEVLVLLRDHASADRYFDQVLDLVPDDGPSLLWKAVLPLYGHGDVAALAAAADDPRFDARHRLWIPRALLGWTAALYERDYERALGYLDGWQDEAWSDFTYVSKAGARAVTYELAGQPDEAQRQFEHARAHVETVLANDPENPLLLMALGEALAGLGEDRAARQAGRRAIELLEEINDSITAPAQRLDSVLRVLVPTGAVDMAFEELDTYLSNPGVWSIEGLLPDPRLDPIREDARFAELVEKHKRR
jgi:DNA-binding winged helix-turn-helix (wHTH) protein/tetratricopeptide (TPR) repeat protein